MPLNYLTNTTPIDAVKDTVAQVGVSEKLAQLSSLSFNEFLDTIIKDLLSFSIKVVLAIALFVIGRWIINRIHKVLQKVMIRREVEVSLRTFLLSLVHIILMVVLIITLISILGINTTSFVALFASAGVAIGMALSGTLQNFAGGVMILLFKPYKVGDFIEAQGQTGTVKEIQIFNTILNTPDNKTIFIPNGGLSTGIINNYSKEGMRRVEWSFGIAYGTDYDFAKELLEKMIKADKRIKEEPMPLIALHSLGDNSVNIVVRAWVDVDEFWDLYYSLNEQVYKTFNDEGINIPFPQLDVHIQAPSN